MPEKKYTHEDLKVMQEWSLERKIQVTQLRIMEFYHRYNGKVNVSFSGGKDSTVLLDLARKVFPDIEAVFVDTGLEFPEVRRFARNTPNVTILRPKMKFDAVVKEFGWCYPSKDVAELIYYVRKKSSWAINAMKGLNTDGSVNSFKQRYIKWQYLLDSPFKISAKCCEIMKENPINKYNKKTDSNSIIGTMASDSQRRKLTWLMTGCNNFSGKTPISKPMSFWTTQDVLTYIHTTQLPIASVYGEIVYDNAKNKLVTTGEERTGCIFCPVGCHLDKINKFQRLADNHPKLHKYCMEKLGLGEFLDYCGIAKN